MKDIKFRVWNDKEGMEYIDDFYWFEENGVHDSSGQGHYKKFELMQYIGLKDINGKRIYEGDIVSYYNVLSDKYVIDLEKTNGIVEWCEYQFCFKPREIEVNHKGGRYFTSCEFTGKMEVIGNIYENSELLEDNNV